jgi:hypothetical protein
MYKKEKGTTSSKSAKRVDIECLLSGETYLKHGNIRHKDNISYLGVVLNEKSDTQQMAIFPYNIGRCVWSFKDLFSDVQKTHVIEAFVAEYSNTLLHELAHLEGVYHPDYTQEDFDIVMQKLTKDLYSKDNPLGVGLFLENVYARELQKMSFVDRLLLGVYEGRISRMPRLYNAVNSAMRYFNKTYNKINSEINHRIEKYSF